MTKVFTGLVMVLGSKYWNISCCLVPAHARCYDGDVSRRVYIPVLLSLPQLVPKSRLINSLRDYDLHKRVQQERKEQSLPLRQA